VGLVMMYLVVLVRWQSERWFLRGEIFGFVVVGDVGDGADDDGGRGKRL
jgi:hypothetical protein